jgi:hypothetical protein
MTTGPTAVASVLTLLALFFLAHFHPTRGFALRRGAATAETTATSAELSRGATANGMAGTNGAAGGTQCDPSPAR